MSNDYWNNEIKQDTFVKDERLCPICKWNLIDCCANFNPINPKDKNCNNMDDGDYFIYCGNKGCENHKGVYYYCQEDPMELLK